VLRSGQRLKVTGYQLLGDKYHLQLSGGFVDIAAADVVTIEPEDVFTPVPPTVAPQPLYATWWKLRRNVTTWMPT